MRKLVLIPLFLCALAFPARSQTITPQGSGASVVNPSTNGAAYWDGVELTTTPTGGAGTLCLTSASGGVPAWSSCAGSASTAWSALSNPSGNMAVNVGVNLTQWTVQGNTGTNNLFSIIDTTGNTGTGSLFEIHTVGTSSAKPFAATAKGTANGVQMDNTGSLAAVGTGAIVFTSGPTTGLTGTITNAQLAGSITAAKLVGTDIATVGTITAGTWHSTVIGSLYGGTGGDSSGSTGIAHIAAGAWSYSTIVAADIAANAVTLPKLATQAADTVVTNASGSVAAPTAVAWPTTGTNGCAGASNAIGYNTTTHAFVCNSITAGSSAFSAITGSTNTTAAMVVGSGASLAVSGSGTIGATSAPVAGITGLGTGVGTALGAAVSGSGSICLATGSACSGAAAAPPFFASTTSTVITMGAGACGTLASGYTQLAGTYTVTHSAGTDTGTISVGCNQSNQVVAYAGASGVTAGNYTVVGFLGSTLQSGNPPQGTYTTAITVTAGVFSAAPTQNPVVTLPTIVTAGGGISVASGSVVSFLLPLSNAAATNTISGTNLSGSAGAAVCDDGSGGVKDTSCSGGSGYSTIDSNGSAITQRAIVNFISGTNATVACVDNSGATRSDCTISASSSAGSRLDQITAATGANTINNANNPQIWNFAQTSNNQVGLKLSENTASTGGTGTSQALFESITSAGSTAIPGVFANSLSGSQTLPTLYIFPTWNTTGVVDAALLMNVTNTASGTGSLLADLQVGGVSQFKVDKAGNLTVNGCTGCGAGTGTVTHTGSLTTNYIAVGNGTADIKTPSSAAQVDSSGNIAAQSLIAITGVVLGTQIAPAPISITWTNNTSTGTNTGKVVRLDTTASEVVQVSGSDTDAYGICVTPCGTSGAAQIATGGTASCVFDNTATAPDYVQYTAATGDCHDTGSTTFPTSGTKVLGRVVTAGTGTQVVAVEVQQPIGSGGSGTVTSVICGTGLSGGTITTSGMCSITAPVTVALGGTNATSAGIAAFNNITGYTASGATGTTSTNIVFSASPTLTGTITAAAYTGSGAFTNNGSYAGSAIVPVPQGGIGVGTLAAHGPLIGEGTSAVAAASPGTSGQCYLSNGASTDPSFQACPGGAGAGNSVTNVTPVTVNTNTTSDQQLMELSLGAGYFNSAKQPFLFDGAGLYTTQTAQTPTITLKIKLCTISGCGSGTVVTLISIVSTATIAAVTNNNWNLSVLGYTATTGATGNLEIHGPLAVDLGALTTTADSIFVDTNTAVSSNIDLTAALFVDFTIAFSTNAVTANTFTQRSGGVMPFAATAAPVASFSGDGTLISNSLSTGAVTATLATAAAHKFWMNNTGSTAAPGYQSATLADLPGTVVNATSPGVGLCHFAGSTQACTSSAVALATADVSGVLPTANIAVALVNQTSINGVTVLSSLTAGHLVFGSSTNTTGDMGADFTFNTHTLTGGSSSITDISAAPVTTGFKLPSAAGAVPTADGQSAFNTTLHAQVWGSNGSTIVGAAAGTGTTGSTTCTNQFVSKVDSVAAPTCSPITAAALPVTASVFGSGTLTLPAGNSIFASCSSTCSIPVPVPVQGYIICVQNNAGVSTVITLSALGSSALYPKPDNSGYGTAGTGTMVSTAAAGNNLCLVGRDATHYELHGINASANWTSN